ncbi:MAG TPA: hypothetical protein VLG92_03470 [Candidatus Saccharimonadia bacterium]|nr:hypothetical protein [Candidatus Saccharimonadia bacterium]
MTEVWHAHMNRVSLENTANFQMAPSLHPAMPITEARIICGWTLTAETTPWYNDTADHITNEYGVATEVVSLPNPDRPRLAEAVKCIKDSVRDPESTLFIAHSLGFTSMVHYAVSEWAHDPKHFRIGGLVSVAGNVTPVGFDEIYDHFIPQTPRSSRAAVRLMRYLRITDRAAQTFGLLYGQHDPFVSMGHADLISMILRIPIAVDPQAAHFSEEHESNGVRIPKCTENRLLKSMIGRMIMDSRPPSLENKLLTPAMPAHYMRYRGRDMIAGPNVLLRPGQERRGYPAIM